MGLADSVNSKILIKFFEYFKTKIEVLIMAGYQIPPGTIVNNIKSLLRERYKQGFPIIKEIIQNANDGRATNLEFGIVQGFRDAVVHPLLRVPALFFLNDGTFIKSDKEAIRCFGIDANANDKGKIGKFGLGQKSIFHFCEAFFYIARSEDIPEGHGEFINPWANAYGADSKRPEWGEVCLEDRQFLENYLIRHNLINTSNYFLLWIPLRQRMKDERCILANYYADAKSVESNLPQDMNMKIGQLLPLLRHIKNVRYWLENEGGSLQKQFSVSLDNNYPCERCIYPNSDKKAIQEDKHNLQGKIIINLNPNLDSTGICFTGKERILPASDFSVLLGQQPESISNSFWEELQQSSYWTKRVSINELGESESNPDKSIPHCAVVFTKQPVNNQRKGRLTLQWAVFLPLASDDNAANKEEQETYEVIDCEGNQDYTVFLHGYFFLDSGRKYIEGLPKIRTGAFVQKTPTNEDEMIAQWNYLLATQGTLKLFLPSLNDFAKIHHLSTQDISHLSLAIYDSHFFKSSVYKKSICSKFQWVFRIKPSGSNWELIPVNANVRSLPGIPPTWQIFPALQNLPQTYYLIDNQKPNLLLKENHSNWQEAEIANILVSLNVDVLFADISNLNYFLKFLQQNNELIGQTQIQSCLIKLFKTAFTKIGWEKMKQDKINQAIKKLIEYIHPQKRLSLKKFTDNEQTVQTIFNQIYALVIQIQEPLLIYELFEPNSPASNGNLNNEQVKDLLTELNLLLKAATTQPATKLIIEQILEQNNSLEAVLNLVSQLPLFFGYNLYKDERDIYSYWDLQIFKKNSLLFKGNYQTDIAAAIKKALPNCGLIFIEQKIATILGKTSIFKAIPQLTPQSCLQLLSTKPDLANSTERANLLQELIKYV